MNINHKATTIAELVMRRLALRSGLEGAQGFLSDCGATFSFEPDPNLFSRRRAEAQSVGRAVMVAGGGDVWIRRRRVWIRAHGWRGVGIFVG